MRCYLLVWGGVVGAGLWARMEVVAVGRVVEVGFGLELVDAEGGVGVDHGMGN